MMEIWDFCILIFFCCMLTSFWSFIFFFWSFVMWLLLWWLFFGMRYFFSVIFFLGRFGKLLFKLYFFIFSFCFGIVFGFFERYGEVCLLGIIRWKVEVLILSIWGDGIFVWFFCFFLWKFFLLCFCLRWGGISFLFNWLLCVVFGDIFWMGFIRVFIRFMFLGLFLIFGIKWGCDCICLVGGVGYRWIILFCLGLIFFFIFW